MSLVYPASTQSKKSRTEIFNDLHDSQNWGSVSHDGWHLPGTYEQHDWCGSWAYRGCLNVEGHKHDETFHGKGFLKTFQRTCFRADCEICYPKWMARASNKATRRIEKYEKISHRKVKHIVISVPSWKYGLEAKLQRKEAMQVLKDLQCLGGTIIYHPFRYNRDFKQWYYSPHFHVLGFGWISGTAENYKKNGWFVKNLGTRDSTFSTFYYQLSHAGIKKHQHTLVWFGDLSYSKLKVEDLDRELEKCPICQNELVELRFVGPFEKKPPDLECELAIDIEQYDEVNTALYAQQPGQKYY